MNRPLTYEPNPQHLRYTEYSGHLSGDRLRPLIGSTVLWVDIDDESADGVGQHRLLVDAFSSQPAYPETPAPL